MEDQRLKKEEMIEISSDDCTSEDEGTDDYRRGGYHAVRFCTEQIGLGSFFNCLACLGYSHLFNLLLPKLGTEFKKIKKDAKDMADFLIPILDFDPEKRPNAAQCLLHPWINAAPNSLEPRVPHAQSKAADTVNSEQMKRDKEKKEVMEVGMGNMAIN